MGRTVPSWRMVVEEEIKKWEKFKGALRSDDRQIFDDLVNQCRLYASAAGSATLPVKAEAMFLSILFSHHKTLKEIQKRLEEFGKLLQK